MFVPEGIAPWTEKFALLWPLGGQLFVGGPETTKCEERSSGVTLIWHFSHEYYFAFEKTRGWCRCHGTLVATEASALEGG